MHLIKVKGTLFYLKCIVRFEECLNILMCGGNSISGIIHRYNRKAICDSIPSHGGGFNVLHSISISKIFNYYEVHISAAAEKSSASHPAS